MAIHYTRWKYGLSYCLVFVLLFLATYYYDTGRDGWSYITLAFAVVILILLELFIRRTLISLKKNSLYIQTFMPMHTHRIDYNTIERMTVEQTSLGKVFGYGTLHIVAKNNEYAYDHLSAPHALKKQIQGKKK